MSSISENAGWFYLTLTAFGFAFIPLVNLLAQPFNKVESAFKFTIGMTFLYFTVGYVV